jgi:hypothetical protein
MSKEQAILGEAVWVARSEGRVDVVKDMEKRVERLEKLKALDSVRVAGDDGEEDERLEKLENGMEKDAFHDVGIAVADAKPGYDMGTCRIAWAEVWQEPSVERAMKMARQLEGDLWYVWSVSRLEKGLREKRPGSARSEDDERWAVIHDIMDGWSRRARVRVRKAKYFGGFEVYDELLYSVGE